MRRLFTTTEFLAKGNTESRLRWGRAHGRWTRIDDGVYGVGPEPPSLMDRARARVVASRTIATGELAGVLHRLDAVVLRSVPPRSRGLLIGDPVQLGGVLCASLLQTIVELAAVLDDLRWEQALESALRDGLALGELEALVAQLGQRRQPGTTRIRRVLALRPAGAPPTESLLETLMVQLVRMIAGLDAPLRQVNVYDEHGLFVARVDLAWPALGPFIELDSTRVSRFTTPAARPRSSPRPVGWSDGSPGVKSRTTRSQLPADSPSSSSRRAAGRSRRVHDRRAASRWCPLRTGRRRSTRPWSVDACEFARRDRERLEHVGSKLAVLGLHSADTSSGCLAPRRVSGRRWYRTWGGSCRAIARARAACPARRSSRRPGPWPQSRRWS